MAGTQNSINNALGIATATSLNFGASSTNGIIGVTSGAVGAAGVVGELMSNSASTVSISTATAKTIASITLTAGEWDIWGTLTFSPSSTLTNVIVAINTTTDALPVTDVGTSTAYTQYATAFTVAAGQSIPSRMASVSVSGSTAYYLIAQANFASTATANGLIMARRVR